MINIKYSVSTLVRILRRTRLVLNDDHQKTIWECTALRGISSKSNAKSISLADTWYNEMNMFCYSNKSVLIRTTIFLLEKIFCAPESSFVIFFCLSGFVCLTADFIVHILKGVIKILNCISNNVQNLKQVMASNLA